MAVALASCLNNVPVRRDVAMTGEVTLRGRVLPVGGLKEKILAAKRAKLTRVILPKQNEKDLDEIPKHLLRGFRFLFVNSTMEVFQHALRAKAKPRLKPQALKNQTTPGRRKRIAAPRPRSPFRHRVTSRTSSSGS
jgi:ATP-dependent Lon protease